MYLDIERRALQTGLVFALLAALACGGGGGGESETPPGGDPSAGGTSGAGTQAAPPSAEDLCMEAVRLQCNGHVRCCESEEERYPSQEECVSVLQPLCTQDLEGTAYRDGRIAFDEATYRAALDRLREAIESCAPIGPEVWEGVFTGSAREGADCTPPNEGFDYSSLMSCGTSLACVAQAESERRACAPRAGDGEDCFEVDCAIGHFCDAAVQPRPLCRALLANRERCESHGQCESGYCGGRGRCGERTASFLYCGGLSYP